MHSVEMVALMLISIMYHNIPQKQMDMQQQSNREVLK
jgi:predicted membrane channel-forming protein YqfA (hemolysin III family)